MCTRAQREWQGKRWLFIGTLRGFTGDDSGNTEVDFVFSYGHGFFRASSVGNLYVFAK